jgi:Spy/CpxP family protein refolding chaperone
MTDRPRFSISRRGWLAAAVLAGLGLGAAGVAAAGPGWLGHARHGFGHFRGHGGSAFDAEDVRYFVGRALREADASEEQVDRVSEIANAAAADVRALAEAHRARREAFAEALVAADRGALEALRAEELAAADAASQRLVAALADAAEVLTPEQRQRLAEAHAARHGRH